jgi:hypothetical protein
MFTCPHCGNSIDVGPGKVTWWKDPKGGPVSLGCGTLILIAIIVSFFSRGSDDRDAIRDLQREIKTLEQKIDEIDKIDVRPVAQPQTAEKNP